MPLDTAALAAGFGFRKPHYVEVLETAPMQREGAWLEVHSENFFAQGGAARATLRKARELYPVSLHGVGLSLASADKLDTAHLASLKRLVDEIEPAFVSEHLSWGATSGTMGSVHLNDLLPFAYTQEALHIVASHIQQAQEALKRPLMIENISRYLELEGSEMSEAQFLSALVCTSGCELLLDINNLYVNSRNLGVDAWQELNDLPLGAVREIHLAGYSVQTLAEGGELFIDTHSTQVSAPVWQLYERALQRLGAMPTLIEWDQDLPRLDALLAEVRLANKHLAQAHLPISAPSYSLSATVLAN